MLRRYTATLRWRQALPPLFILSLFFWMVVVLFWNGGWLLLGIEVVLYGVALLIGALPAARRHQDLRLILFIPLAITTMHLSWGAGFLWSMIAGIIGVRKKITGMG